MTTKGCFIDTDHLITVIIPTACAPERSQSLMRAIRSIRESSSTKVSILVVANGPRVSQTLLDAVSALPGVRIHRLTVGSAPLATAAGRTLVQTKYFGFLDDDDELLAGALDRRLAVLQNQAEVDIVVSRGWRQVANCRTPVSDEPSGAMIDPLSSLLRANFFASCAGLFRSKTIGQEFFEKPHGFGEWTWLAFRLCLAGKKFHMLGEPDFLVNDTPASLSKTEEYASSYISLYDRMLAERPPLGALRAIKAKRSAAYHEEAERALRRGNRLQAMKLHYSSLLCLHGLKYITFTRHVIFGLASLSNRG